MLTYIFYSRLTHIGKIIKMLYRLAPVLLVNKRKKNIQYTFLELVSCCIPGTMHYMNPFTSISSFHLQTSTLQQIASVVWHTGVLILVQMATKQIRLLQMIQQTESESSVPSLTVSVGGVIESENLCWLSPNQFVQHICSLMALEMKYKQGE